MLPHLAFLLRWQRHLEGLNRRASQQLGSRKSSSQHSQAVLVEGPPPDGCLLLDVTSFSHGVHQQLNRDANMTSRTPQIANVQVSSAHLFCYLREFQLVCQQRKP